MAIPQAWLQELKARVPMPELVGRHVRLKRAGRNWVALCPFHNDSTPSFTVFEGDDPHYHCFGCGEHGDAIAFLTKTRNMRFEEAVSMLASEVGMEVPTASPEAAAVARKQQSIYDLLEAAARDFQRRLRLPEGARALAYLRGRGLTDDTIYSWGLGWAGSGGTLDVLRKEGATDSELAEAGLARLDEDSGRVSGFFFNRVIFPIRDRRGRIISFGGRILGDGQPKYLNGPETSVFSKRRTLFGLDRAREAGRAGTEVMAVEGYMDVIVLHQAGFVGAVAPLGTSLTSEHLGELWKLSPSPALCFDADAAGGLAVRRALDLALPLITPERTLSLVTLPTGMDPDETVSTMGSEAFQAHLAAPRPMVDALFDTLHSGRDLSTPERKAAFRALLGDAAGQIKNRTLANEYRRALLSRFFQTGSRSGMPREGAMPGPEVWIAERARLITALVLRYPEALAEVEADYIGLDLPHPWGNMRAAIFEAADAVEGLSADQLQERLKAVGLGGIVQIALANRPTSLPLAVNPKASLRDALVCFRTLARTMTYGAIQEQIREAIESCVASPNKDAQTRLALLADEGNIWLRREELLGVN
jgi:DNA primase